MKKLTHEEFVKRVDDLYDSKYKDTKTKIEILSDYFRDFKIKYDSDLNA